MVYDPALAPLRRQRLRALAGRPAQPEPRIVQRIPPEITGRIDDLARLVDDLREATAQRLSLIEDRLSSIEDRAAEVVGGVAEDMPAFLRRGMAAPAAAPASPVHEIIAQDAQARLEAIERELAALKAQPAAAGPPLRVVEAAHLARSGQVAPMALMERIGQARGCGWEEAAVAIIREHDEAVAAAVDAYIAKGA